MTRAERIRHGFSGVALAGATAAHTFMVHITARIVARPDTAQALRNVLPALVEPSRNEPGCVACPLSWRSDMPHELQTSEPERTQADADAHMSMPRVPAAIAAARPLLAEPPAINSYALLR